MSQTSAWSLCSTQTSQRTKGHELIAKRTETSLDSARKGGQSPCARPPHLLLFADGRVDAGGGCRSGQHAVWHRREPVNKHHLFAPAHKNTALLVLQQPALLVHGAHPQPFCWIQYIPFSSAVVVTCTPKSWDK